MIDGTRVGVSTEARDGRRGPLHLSMCFLQPRLFGGDCLSQRLRQMDVFEQVCVGGVSSMVCRQLLKTTAGTHSLSGMMQ